MDIFKEMKIMTDVNEYLDRESFPGEISPLVASIIIGALDSTGWIVSEQSNKENTTDDCKFEPGCQGYILGFCALSHCPSFEHR